MGIKIIAGVSHNGVIGKDGHLVLRHKEDLQRFKALTIGDLVVMGRKTWESIGSKPLVDRWNVILTSGMKSSPVQSILDPLFINMNDLKDGMLELMTDDIYDTWCIGGGKLYTLLINFADELHITRWNKVVQGDTFFPEIDLNVWELVGLEEAKTTDEFVFETWRRKEVKDG